MKDTMQIEDEGISHSTIDSYVSERSSRYEARGKFGEHERCVAALAS